MRRLRTLVPGLLVLVATDAYSQEPAALRDPDRGLDPELRERLARVDPARDERWPLERVAARIEAHLAMLSKLWSAGELEQGLAGAAWIAGELRVRALDGRGASEQEQRGAWSFARSAADGEGDQAPFAAALSAWRRAFGGAARLDTELFALEAREGDFLGEIRLVASGMEGGARARDEVTWNTRWRERSGGELALVALAAGALERVTLSGHPRGLFEDVSASFFADDGFHAREVAPGLDAWRRVVPAPLEPGLLGHHGLALGDVDGDGREDLYWCRPGGLPNRLFLHQPDDRVREVSAAFGVDLLDYSSSALLLELDGDGDLDLVVATATGLVFFANDGGRRFTLARRLERSLATSLAAADHDGDGDLDLYCCSYVSPYEASGTPVPYHDANNGEANVLLRNDGDFELVDVTAAVGLDANNRRFSLAASWEDYDQDGDADLYVANDFGLKNLYRNDGGRFVDVAGELDALDVSAGMGVSWGDVDGDGWMDLYATNLHSPAGSRLTGGAARPGSSAENARAYREHARGNTLLMNGRGAPFRDVSEASGTFRGRWGWGALFVDFDADGWLDLYAPNGFVTGERETDLDSFFWRQVVLRSPDGPGAPEGEYDLGWRAVRRLSRQGWSWNGHERNAAFLNLGAERFADVGSLTALDQADDARAAVRVDWDADGDEDLIVANRSAPMLRVLRNGQTGAGWIAFELDGAGRTAIGARVTVTTSGGRPLVRAARCGEGYLAQSSARLEFGLAHEQVQRVSVRWPGGVEEDFGAPGAGARYRLARGSGRAAALAPRAVASALAPASSSLAPAQLGARLVLPEPLALPRLALETSDARAVALFGITPQGPSGTGKPLLIVLWSSEVPASRALLAALSARAGDLAGLQVLALGVAAPEHRPRALAELDAFACPFGRAFASEEALQVLELVQATLRDDARGLALPTSFLVDGGGALVATYEGALEPESVRRDLALTERTAEKRLAADARRAASVPLAGRWLTPPPAALDEKVAARLAAHGLARSAAEYSLARIEVRATSRARLAYDAGVAAHRQGRVADAITHYRRALAEDPTLALAAQDLAVALHQDGRIEEAQQAYREALRLEPGHALTRSNLGHLLFDRGDLEGARRELAALRELKSELAAELATRLGQ